MEKINNLTFMSIPLEVRNKSGTGNEFLYFGTMNARYGTPFSVLGSPYGLGCGRFGDGLGGGRGDVREKEFYYAIYDGDY